MEIIYIFMTNFKVFIIEEPKLEINKDLIDIEPEKSKTIKPIPIKLKKEKAIPSKSKKKQRIESNKSKD